MISILHSKYKHKIIVLVVFSGQQLYSLVVSFEIQEVPQTMQSFAIAAGGSPEFDAKNLLLKT